MRDRWARVTGHVPLLCLGGRARAGEPSLARERASRAVRQQPRLLREIVVRLWALALAGAGRRPLHIPPVPLLPLPLRVPVSPVLPPASVRVPGRSAVPPQRVRHRSGPAGRRRVAKAPSFWGEAHAAAARRGNTLLVQLGLGLFVAAVPVAPAAATAEDSPSKVSGPAGTKRGRWEKSAERER